MPIIGSLAGASSKSLGGLGASIANIAKNYMTVIKSTTSSLTGIDVLYDTSSVYLAFNDTTSQKFGAMKINSDGSSVSWNTTKDLGAYTGYNGVSKASDGNIIYTGYNNSNARQSGRAKINSSTGAQIWSYYYGINGYGNGGTIDGAGNIWSAQQTGGGAGLLRTDSNGDNPSFWYVNNVTYCTKATYNSSTGNIYALITGPASQYNLTVWALSQSGAEQLQYEFNTNYSTDGNIQVDSSGNIYIASYAADSGTTGGRAFVMKVNTSGTITAQRLFDSGTGAHDGFTDCVLDNTNGFLYCVGSSGGKGVVVKYNTSLVLQWQRTLTGVSDLSSINLIDDNNIQICGTYGGTGGGIFTAKLKTDGSGTGTYAFTGGNVVYAASSITDSAASFTRSSPGRAITNTTPSRGNTATLNDTLTTTVQSLVI